MSEQAQIATLPTTELGAGNAASVGTLFKDSPDLKTAPIIGISMQDATSESGKGIIELVKKAGGIPYIIDNQKIHNPEKDLSIIDSLILMGSDNDINPALYNQPKHEKTLVAADESRDDYEAYMIEKALEQKIPLLGVCCGMQRINVGAPGAGGGTLNQHIEGFAKQGDVWSSHSVGIVKDSLLGEIAKAANHSIDVRTNNHQTIANLRDGFTISAVDKNLVPMAIEADKNGRYKDQFVMGTQFHPEIGNADFGTKLIKRVVEEGHKYLLAREPSFARNVAFTSAQSHAAALN